MPIFAYRCAHCGFDKDALQKRQDPPLVDCPQCGQPKFARRLTAPAFQLKGSGWYVTDFRDGAKAKGEPKPDEAKAGEGKSGEAGGGEAKTGVAAGESSSAAAAGTASAAAAAPAPGKAPDSPPAGAKPAGRAGGGARKAA
ncbi:MAG TPA: FmdB family zinc ribbon protein [Burkholderiaceae bacterium]